MFRKKLNDSFKTLNKSVVAIFILLLLIVSAIGQPIPPTIVSNRCSAYAAPSVPAPLRTVYVNADSGNDSNNGLTPATAWRTIHPKANNSAQVGDLILLRGVFTNQWINPNASGTSANKITYRKEPGQTAILEATSGASLYGIVIGAGRSHIVVDGLEIRNTPNPFQIIDGGSYIWLRNLYIHDSGGSTFRLGANNNRLEDSVLVDIGSNQANLGDSVNLYGDADNNIVVRNYFGNAGHGAYDIIPDLSGNSDNNIFAQNIVDNQWSSGILVNGRAVNTLVECNIIRNSTQNTTFNYPRMGIQLSGDNNIIRYNYIYNNKSDGILLTGYIFATVHLQYPENNQIYHNTIVGNGRSGLYMHVTDAGYPNASAFVRNNIIENNIFWGNGGGNFPDDLPYDVVGNTYFANNPWSSSFIDGNIFRYNNASNRPFFAIYRNLQTQGNCPTGGANLCYETPELAQATFPTWTNNRRQDPLFTNPSTNDYSLQSNSPMIDQGRIIPGVQYNGSAPDLGAFESGGTPPTQSPYPGPNTPSILSTLEAENFDKGGQGIAYNENYGSTSSNVYRSNPVETVDIIANSNASNGFAVNEAAANEWLEYTVNVPSAGLYNFAVRYSSGYSQPFSQGKVRIEVCEATTAGGVTNCVSSTDITVNSTGGWSNFNIVKAPLYLPVSGTRILRLLMIANAPGDTNCQCVVANFDSITVSNQRTLFDYDNDRKADVSVFRPSNSNWYLQQSANGFFQIQFGATGDTIAPADFDGDGKADIAIYRPNGTNGSEWWIRKSSDSSVVAFQFGVSSDLTVQGDYTGDGKADAAVWRPSNGNWFVLRSEDNSYYAVPFGATGDIPAPGDYDGDGKFDLAVFRPSTNTWYIQQSTAGTLIVQFGLSGDKVTPADYDGDGKTDISVWRPSNGRWYRLNSSGGQFIEYPLGSTGDIPSPADFDGDGKADYAVFRPSTGVWYLQQSTNGTATFPFGVNGDVPTPSTYVR